jgi:ferrous iron transport protein B
MSDNTLRLALVGNPNCGKTALFNRLTGSRQKVANYAGVTVERKEGRLVSPSGRSCVVLDLPGAYSLQPGQPGRGVTRDICRGTYPGEPKPDALVCVIDATNLRLHLRFVLEVRELGLPMVVALNMADAARGAASASTAQRWSANSACRWSKPSRCAATARRPCWRRSTRWRPASNRRSTGLLPVPTSMPRRVACSRSRWNAAPHRAHRRRAGPLAAAPGVRPADLAVVMFLIFQAVYAWATPLMDLIDAGTKWLGAQAAAILPEGPLASLVVDGIIAAWAAWWCSCRRS